MNATCKKNLAALRDAVEQTDMEVVVSSAHAMKGAGMNMAAINFSGSCKTMEMQAREDNIVDPQAQIKNIEDEYLLALKELRALG